jgi:hypothetical protein
LVDGGKFMFPNALDWILYVVACIGLALQAERLRAGGMSNVGLRTS